MHSKLFVVAALVLSVSPHSIEEAAVSEADQNLPCNYDYCVNYCEDYVCKGWPNTEYW